MIYALQGNGIDRADTSGCNGCGWREGVGYTLNTIDRHAVAFSPFASAQQPNCIAYPEAPCAEASKRRHVLFIDCRNHTAGDVSATLQAEENGGQSLNFIHQVCYDARGNGDGTMVPTLTGDHENRVTDYTAIAIENGQLNQISMAQPRKYIVRRLTPLECCRLQGFPDGWAKIRHADEMDDSEAAFWEKVRKTHAEMNVKKYKPFKDRAALIKWHNGLHTDSAEYKMWGNGIALPCAEYVLQRIVQTISIRE